MRYKNTLHRYGKHVAGGNLVAMALLVAGAICLATPRADATVIGPDTFGYTASDLEPFNFEDISATGTLTLGLTDDGVTTQTLPFTFNFYGTNYNSVSWNTNGFLMFAGSDPAFTNEDFSTAIAVNLPVIAPLWDDWKSYNSTGVYFETRGLPGAQRFIVQWHDLDHFNTTPSTVRFQAVLFEGSNDITFQYADVLTGDTFDNGASATVGIRNTDGQTNGQNLQWSFDSAVISTGQAIRFSTPEPATAVLLVAGAMTMLMRRRRSRLA